MNTVTNQCLNNNLVNTYLIPKFHYKWIQTCSQTGGMTTINAIQNVTWICCYSGMQFNYCILNLVTQDPFSEYDKIDLYCNSFIGPWPLFIQLILISIFRPQYRDILQECYVRCSWCTERNHNSNLYWLSQSSRLSPRNIRQYTCTYCHDRYYLYFSYYTCWLIKFYFLFFWH